MLIEYPRIPMHASHNGVYSELEVDAVANVRASRRFPVSPHVHARGVPFSISTEGLAKAGSIVEVPFTVQWCAEGSSGYLRFWNEDINESIVVWPKQGTSIRLFLKEVGKRKDDAATGYRRIVSQWHFHVLGVHLHMTPTPHDNDSSYDPCAGEPPGIGKSSNPHA